MTIAYVLINVQSGAEEQIIEKLKNLENVVEAYVTYGTYDILVKIVADSLEKIKETVDMNIRKLDKVRSSITMIVMEKWMTQKS